MRKFFHSVQFVLVQGHASHQRLHQLIYRKPEYAICQIDVIEWFFYYVFLKGFQLIPYRMQIYMKFNLVIGLRLVNYIELDTGKLWSLVLN